MKAITSIRLFSSAAILAGLVAVGVHPSTTSAQTTRYNINTLAGKVASVNGTAGLQIRMSAFIEQEADEGDGNTSPASPITPSNVLSSPLDGTSVAAPNVTVNQDTAGAPQNETSIAVDPNNPSRVVASANEYVSRTWACTVGSAPCSGLGEGYSGTYVSNDGGQHWCCLATDPNHLGTLIPGVEHLTGGQYDAGGDPALAFDSRGNVYYSGLGFDRNSAPNTVTVNKGTFDASGNLSWSAPTFIGQTTAPSTLNDKEWIAVDSHVSSPFRDRVYVTWTRFIFNPANGNYVQSPISFAYSTNGGQTFSAPQLISGNVLYGQGSHPVVSPDGTLYVFWDGSTRLSALNSTWMVKSTDGGVSWSKPVAVAPLVDIINPANTAFRVNSFPAATVTPNGTLYATWSTEIQNGAPSNSVSTGCASWIVGAASVRSNCHAAVVYSRSTDGGVTWSAPAFAFTEANRTPEGYPVTQPDGKTTLTAPVARPVESFFPAITASSSGRVYLSSYTADVVSPWQTCAQTATPTTVGRINCLQLGDYTNNARLDYVVADLSTGVTRTVTTHPINTRSQFGGGFIGDYTDIAAGSDNSFHALWTDTNNRQTVTWFYGYQFASTSINQEDVVSASDNF